MSIRPTFMGYETAKSALNYAQKAIDIVGNNISNGSTTTGYTRQRVEAVANYTNTTTGRIVDSKVPLAGQGVSTIGVSQTRDVYLESAFRDQYSNASYYAESTDLLTRIQTRLGTGSNISDTSEIMGAIQKVYESVYDYAKNPTADAQANVVYSSFQTLVSTINSTYSSLNNERDTVISETESGVDRVNTLLGKIANINKQMATEATFKTDGNTYFYDNELMDQRNVLVDELAGYGDITVKEYDDGTCDIMMAGATAVSGENASALLLQNNDDGTVAIKWRESGETADLKSGSLLSDLQYINGRGTNIQSNNETPEKGFLYYMDRLDTLAASVANMVNKVIPTTDSSGNIIKDGSGNTVYKTLLGATQADGTVSTAGTITAENLSISDEWTKGGASYFIFNKNKADYSYAYEIATKLTGSDYTFSSYGESFTGTFEEYVTDYVTVLSDSVSKQSGLQKTAAEVADDYQDSRDGVEAVNQDEETSNMLSYQKLYQAAARVLTTMDDMLDVIINKMAV